MSILRENRNFKVVQGRKKQRKSNTLIFFFVIVSLESSFILELLLQWRNTKIKLVVSFLL